MKNDSYSFKDLVDLAVLRRVFERYSRTTGFTVGVHDHIRNELLVMTGWRDICVKYHRACEASAQFCKTSNTKLTAGLKEGEVRLNECEHGLVDGCAPIFIQGRHLANLCTGQALLAPPDTARFKKQAAKFGYDEDAYLEALSKVPIVTEEAFRANLLFLSELATQIAEIGLAKLRLNKSEERYRKLFEESLDGIFVISPDGGFVDANRAALEIFGVESLDGLSGKRVFDFTASEYERRKIRSAIASRDVVEDLTWTLFREGGGEVAVQESLTPVRDDDGRLTGYRCIIRDITEKLVMERQLAHAQKMKSIGALAGGVAHDFNNILVIVQGYAELGLTHLENREELKKDFEMILTAGGRAKRLVGQLLAFGRKQEYRPRVVDMNELLHSMEEMLSSLLGDDVIFQMSLTEGALPVKMDVPQMEQAIMNLVINSRDSLATASPEEKRLSISTASVFSGGLAGNGNSKRPCVRLSVSDNGTGIDESIKERIFEPFFSTKGEVGGSGLGLASVYGSVTQCGGYVTVDSTPGEGAVFNIYLPEAEGGGGGRCVSTMVPERAGGGETVLVVEDEESVRDFTVRSLRRLGYNVSDAEDGLVALNLLGDESFKCDLVLTDIMMPKVNGVELAKRLLKTRPEIALLFISGYSHDLLSDAGEDLEEVEFLRKPYSIKVLERAVRQALDRKTVEMA